MGAKRSPHLVSRRDSRQRPAHGSVAERLIARRCKRRLFGVRGFKSLPVHYFASVRCGKSSVVTIGSGTARKDGGAGSNPVRRTMYLWGYSHKYTMWEYSHNHHGGRSSVVERQAVALDARVRSPSVTRIPPLAKLLKCGAAEVSKGGSSVGKSAGLITRRSTVRSRLSLPRTMRKQEACLGVQK